MIESKAMQDIEQIVWRFSWLCGFIIPYRYAKAILDDDVQPDIVIEKDSDGGERDKSRTSPGDKEN